MKTIEIKGQVYILIRTRKGWKYFRPTTHREMVLENTDLAEMFGIEME